MNTPEEHIPRRSVAPGVEDAAAGAPVKRPAAALMKKATMDEDKWKAFIDFIWDRIGRRMHDDVTPAEVVTWLLRTWHDDPDRPSRDEVLRHYLECTVADMKQKLPTWWQIHEGIITGKNPFECERKVTPRPLGAGIFRVGSMEDLRADVVRNGLAVIEGGKSPSAA
jgi:hypothetical protein